MGARQSVAQPSQLSAPPLQPFAAPTTSAPPLPLPSLPLPFRGDVLQQRGESVAASGTEAGLLPASDVRSSRGHAAWSDTQLQELDAMQVLLQVRFRSRSCCASFFCAKGYVPL